MSDDIKCPNCGESISVDDVLKHQIEERIKKDWIDKERTLKSSFEEEKQKIKDNTEQQLKDRELEFEKEKEKYKERLEKEQSKKEKELQEELEKKEKEIEEKLEIKINKKAESEKQAIFEKNKLLEDQLEEKAKALSIARQNELGLIKEKQRLKDEKDAFELEKARQLDEERKKIEEEASKKATEASQSKIDQLNKKLEDATKAKDELARKLEQGSQQTQGEVQELKLEEILKKEFPFDQIDPVPKGVNGADIIQTVNTKLGNVCGKIIWESKNTKAWSDGWIQKLKDDQRVVKADIAILVSNTLPNGVKGMIQKDNVWVCDMNIAIPIAATLREGIISVAREKYLSTGKDEKMEMLYSYISGTEFRQRIEAIVEVFTGMKKTLDDERKYFEKSWAEKEKQIQKVIKNTVGIYGDLSGVVTLPKIDALELPNPEDIKNV